MFSRSLGFNNVQPKVLYHFAGQWWTMMHNKYTTFFLVPAQSEILLLCESEIKDMDCKGCVAC